MLDNNYSKEANILDLKGIVRGGTSTNGCGMAIIE